MYPLLGKKKALTVSISELLFDRFVCICCSGEEELRKPTAQMTKAKSQSV